jgi:hypothetical protein
MPFSITQINAFMKKMFFGYQTISLKQKEKNLGKTPHGY